MPELDPAFAHLLRGFDQDHLAGHAGTVYGLWPDLTLAYFNEAWLRFANENDGEPAISSRWGIGTCIKSAISPPLRDFYVREYQKCLQGAKPWDHKYECSSAESFRIFHMIVYPLGDAEGALVINSLVVDQAHDAVSRPVCEPIEQNYADEDGTIHQCMHCRRMRRSRMPEQWDWVPTWVKECPWNVSHGLCQLCLDFYYPDLENEPETVSM